MGVRATFRASCMSPGADFVDCKSKSKSTAGFLAWVLLVQRFFLGPGAHARVQLYIMLTLNPRLIILPRQPRSTG